MHKITLPDWAVAEDLRMNYFPRIDLARTAHLCIDMQNSFVKATPARSNKDTQDIVPNINRIVGAFRKLGVPTLWTRHTFSDKGQGAIPQWQLERTKIVDFWRAGTMPGTPEHAIYDGMDVAAEDEIVDKYRMSCFIQGSSDLQQRLERRNIDTLVITGTLTNACCESTARDAAMLDYKVLFVADGTATVSDHEHNAALLNLRRIFAHVVTTEELLGIAAKSAEPAMA